MERRPFVAVRHACRQILLERVPLLLLIGLQGIERLLDESTAQVLFVGWRQFRVAGHVDYAGAENDAVGADHFGDRQGGCDLHDGNASFLQLGGDRSAAASTGPSRRGENHRVDAVLLDFLGDFPAEAARVR
jgi:hypothetical protein